MANELILLFEDDDGSAEFYTDMLQMHDYRIRHYFRPTDFLAQKDDIARLLDESALVLTDGDMPGKHGLDFARELRTDFDYTKPIVYNSGRLPADHELPNKRYVTRKDGSDILLVNYCLEKPVLMKTLVTTLADALKAKP